MAADLRLFETLLINPIAIIFVNYLITKANFSIFKVLRLECRFLN